MYAYSWSYFSSYVIFLKIFLRITLKSFLTKTFGVTNTDQLNNMQQKIVYLVTTRNRSLDGNLKRLGLKLTL